MKRDSLGLADANRYAELDLNGDAVIVYDRTRTQAWIQSDHTVPTDVAADDATASASETERHRERQLAAAHAERPVNGGDSE